MPLTKVRDETSMERINLRTLSLVTRLAAGRPVR
jgi:hypothetical protein